MSHLYQGTDETERGPCFECGAKVTRSKRVPLHDGRVWWRTPAHRAPCGAACLGGGVPPKDYRAGNFHGGALGRSKCPCVSESGSGSRR